MSNQKILIICQSIHHGNTLKIAKAIADELNAKVKKPSEVNIKDINNYDLIGFGSGIYDDRNHKLIFDLVDKLPKQNKKKAFVFSTSGVPITILGKKYFDNYTKKCSNSLEEILASKGFVFLGEFSCPGFNTNSFLKYLGGINKHRPNKEDLEKAKEFAKKMIGS